MDVTTLLMDKDFECMRTKIPGVDLNKTVAKLHVP